MNPLPVTKRELVGSSIVMMALVAMLAILMTSCVTPSRQTVRDSLPLIETAANLATGAILKIAFDQPDERKKISDWIYSIAAGVRTVSGGKVPTVPELRATIAMFSPQNAGSKWVEVSTALGSLWAWYYPQIGDDPKLCWQVLESISAGLESAAKHILEKA